MIRLQPKLYLRKDKIDKAGRMPVYIIFPRINGEEPRFSLGRGIRLTMAEWDTVKRLPKDECLSIEVEREIERINREIHLCNLNDTEITKAILREIVKGYELANPKNNSFSSTTINNTLQELAKKAEINKKITFHLVGIHLRPCW